MLHFRTRTKSCDSKAGGVASVGNSRKHTYSRCTMYIAGFYQIVAWLYLYISEAYLGKKGPSANTLCIQGYIRGIHHMVLIDSLRSGLRKTAKTSSWVLFKKCSNRFSSERLRNLSRSEFSHQRFSSAI